MHEPPRRRCVRTSLPLAPRPVLGLALAAAAPAALAALAVAQDPKPHAEAAEDPHAHATAHDDRARPVEHTSSAFRPDPTYPAEFSFDEQRRTYSKAAVKTQRPLLELGRELYTEGPFTPGSTFLGEKNLIFPSLMVFGDWRTAAGFSDNGAQEVAQVATRLNLNVNLQLTATERLHAFFQPLDKDGDFTRVEFGGDDQDFDGDGDDAELHLDGEPEALFFEGDLGAIGQGFSGKENTLDLPFAVGKIPLLFQNGVWVEDAFWGGAVSIPASNSRALDISNYDVTFFVGIDDVTSAGVLDPDAGGTEGTTKIVGVTSFLELGEGYAEIGYGYTTSEAAGDDPDYHNLTASFTKRYADWLSNSVRVIFNFGQDIEGPETADGVLLLVENSFRTRAPYTFIPYLNLFLGVDSPQSLARAAGAGGVLKNTGINFETNALTLFPKLDDTGHDAWGGALGIEYLFDLYERRQFVLEIAGQHPYGSEASAPGDELAIGARYQFALDNSWILRFDAMAATIEDADDLLGVAVEIRKKF